VQALVTPKEEDRSTSSRSFSLACTQADLRTHMADRKALLARFSKLEAQRSALLRVLEGETPERLEKAPKPGAWSVAQVILHLAIAEEGVINYIDKKRSVGGHGPVGAMAPLRLALLNTALALPLKFKAPAVVATVPPCTYAEACARWQAVRERMQDTFATIPEELIGHGLIKHPSAGKFDLVQGLRFVRWHVRHHVPQITRTLRSLV
jgi:hypothetical protein